jgi:hypothetical protein
VAGLDLLAIVDVSASFTKKITVANLIAAGLNLVANNSIDLAKLNQASTTKLTALALAPQSVEASKLANNSSIAVQANEPTANNFIGRGFFNSQTQNLKLFNGSTFLQLVLPTEGLADLSVTTPKLAPGAVTTDKVTPLGTAAYADASVTSPKLAPESVTESRLAPGAVTAPKLAPAAVTTPALAPAAVTYDRIQNLQPDRLLGRASGSAGPVQELPLTAPGRALLAAPTVPEQRDALGLGNLALGVGTWVDGSSFSGSSSGVNTGDQTITLTGAVTGSGRGTFPTTLSPGVVQTSNIAPGAVTGPLLALGAVTADRLAGNSATIINSSAPSGSGSFIGQRWFNPLTGEDSAWTGSTWVRIAGLTTLQSAAGGLLNLAITYPEPNVAELALSFTNQPAATVLAGPASGADAAPTFRALLSTDLPLATSGTAGISRPGTGLIVTEDGILNHSNVLTAGTISGITVDAQGHITGAVPLQAADIPELDASKLTSGLLNVNRIPDSSITAQKLADYATAKIGEGIPVADFIGQILMNPLTKAFSLWDGNIWVPLSVNAGQVVFAGTYNANLNQMASVTADGAAIGLTVGLGLPAASALNNGYYVVVSTAGTGVSPAPATALAPPDNIISNGTTWVELDVSSTFIAQTAANISFASTTDISATNVQAAIVEVSNETRNASNLTSGLLAVARGGTGLGTYTKGNLLVGNASNGLTALGVGTNGQVLSADSTTATGIKWLTLPTWVSSVSSTTAALTVANPTTTPALTLRSASTTVNGIVQLTNSVSTSSSTLAATATAVKTAYDLAAAALPANANAVSATKLQTARNINGIPFDGTAAITVTAKPDNQEPRIFYVRSDGSNSRDGRNAHNAFQHVEHALDQIRALPEPGPWTVKILDDFTTAGELEVPDFTTIWGANLQRRTVCRPTTGNQQRNVFLCGNGVHLYGLKFANWQIDDFDNPTKGFAMAFRPGAIILPGGVPYGQNCVVTSALTEVPTPLPMDPENGNPAHPRGGGCVLADASVLSAYSVFPNIMTWGFTPSSHNGLGYVARNRGFINPVNAIGVGAHRHFMALDGGQMVVSGSSSQFGDYSFWSEGSIQRVIPLKVPPSAIATQTGAAAIITAAKASLINDVWTFLVANHSAGSWPSGFETLTRKDSGLFLDAISACLVHGFERPMLNFAEGMFNFDGTCVYTYAYHTAFKASWDRLASQLIAGGQLTAGAVTFVNALVARLKATLDNYWYEVSQGPAPTPVEPVRRKLRSEITAINHQWTAPFAGVEFYRVPPARAARRIARSIIRKNGGRVRFSGQDDAGNAVFVGGLTIDARSGQLGGPPFDTALRGRVTRAVISRSY